MHVLGEDENIFLAIGHNQQSLHSMQQGTVGKRSLSRIHPANIECNLVLAIASSFAKINLGRKAHQE